ncbi:thrombomodulin-like [Scleropages formosus]|uniref:Thrombomodulin n=1 Tax=Scleropages formosus TaxID=113540 RepID=A0A0N8K0I4_SCLFO|nr:thrombomodulin-like [Scleropages formosus]
MSAESRDALRVLLDGATVSGDLWTGLQLPNRNCAEPLLKPSRRRFQWMDEELSGADFPAATGTESQACAPLCVSLSRDFTLTERPCHDQISGYICAHAQSPASACDPLALPLGSGEVALFNLSAEGGEGRCSAVAGSIAVLLPSRAKFLCTQEDDSPWLRGPWSCEVFMGGCQHKCSTHDMRPQCICPPGAVLERNNLSCVEAPNGDPCASARCEHMCLPHVGCQCWPGYELKEDGKGCRDIDECQDERVCKGMLCSNNPGSFECTCPSGYQQKNNKCVDINECSLAPCEHICHNTDGSYTCSCRDGFAPNPKDRRECVQHCPSYECPAICDPNNPEQCRCPLGYIYDVKATQGVCVDINECEMDACDQSCDNTFGSFSCSCYKGYYMDDGGMCRLVDGGLTTPTYSDSSTPTVKQTPGDASLMTPGAMVGIIVCILLIIVVLMFLVHRKRWTMNRRGAHKPHDEHSKDLQQVTTEEDMKTFANRHLNQNSA